MEAVGGSFDEMLHPEKNKDEIKETSILALKDVYEYQLATLKETSEEHIRNIRTHYQQHHSDLKENFERRLADKRELLESYKEHIDATKNDKRKLWLTTCVLASILFLILVADVMFGNVGWIRY